jgi:hypothetical protein
MMILCRNGFLISDFRFPNFGTQSALASFHEERSQALKSKIKNQKSKFVQLPGGGR